MTIKERIKSLGSYFQEMQITNVDGQQLIYVVVRFPNGWLIDEDIEEKFNIQVQEGTNRGDYYFCADIDVGEEAIFDAIEYNVDKMRSAIERANLLKAKIEELRGIFEDENVTVEQLRGLSFSFQEETKLINDTFDSKDNTPVQEILLPIKKGRKPKNNQLSEQNTEEVNE